MCYLYGTYKPMIGVRLGLGLKLGLVLGKRS